MRGLILSAGLGERLRPLTLKRAKPALEFLNMPMLTFPYHWLNTLGLKEVVFNTHYLPDSIRRAAMHIVSPGIRLHFSHEAEILGSGGGIWNARFDLMNDKVFAVANGDAVVLDPDPHLMQRMLEQHKRNQAVATLLVCPLEGVGSKIPGVWINRRGMVRGFGKVQPEPETECFHYASFMLFSNEIWSLLPAGGSNILYDVLEPALKQGAQVESFRADDLLWFETGNVGDYLSATKRCLEMMVEGSPLGLCARDILNHHAPNYTLRTRWDRCHLISDTAEIPTGLKLNGFAVIGDRAQVAAGASLQDCVVLPDATVASGLHRAEVLI